MKLNEDFEKTITSSENIERWRYPRFFSDNIDEENAVVTITGGDAAHILKVLRMKRGDLAVICDGKGTDRLCSLEDADRDTAVFGIRDTRACEAEPGVYLRLFQSLPKSDKLEFIVQKAVELGACEVIPVLSARCVSRPDETAAEKKRVRLQKIADEAAKQCGRGILPTVGRTLTFAEALAESGGEALGIFFYECGGLALSEILSGRGDVRKIDVFIGPEGGYEAEEAQKAREAGLITASLGKRILRCETAPVAAISILMNMTGNM